MVPHTVDYTRIHMGHRRVEAVVASWQICLRNIHHHLEEQDLACSVAAAATVAVAATFYVF